jgi:hypothetical protein
MIQEVIYLDETFRNQFIMKGICNKNMPDWENIEGLIKKSKYGKLWSLWHQVR